MQEPNNLRVKDIRELLHLACDLYDRRDDDWKTRMLQGLCALTGAAGGLWARIDTSGQRPPIVGAAVPGAARLDIGDLAVVARRHRQRLATELTGEDRRRLYSLFPLADRRFFAAIYLGAERPFTVSHRLLLHLLHSEMGSLYRRDGQDDCGLSPRLRQTLDLLLAGCTERQTAQRLGLSPHTIHVYVRDLYRRYKVGSRAELLIRLLPQ